MFRLGPEHTVELVARTLIVGLEDGSIILERPAPEISAVEDEIDALTAILNRFKAQGLHVEILDVNGTPTPIVVRPELAEAARQLALSAAKVVAEVASPAGES